MERMARKKGYGQFCPVAQAAEIVAERWTPLILRELICGSRRFNDLRKGVPLMSPSLLSQRLRELEDAGVLERSPAQKGGGSEYHLTRAGQELRPVIEMLGLWGHRWVQREIRRDELDPALLMWDIRRCVDPEPLPADRRTVVQFDLDGVPHKKSRWWLVFDRGEVDLCLKSPGYDVDLQVASHIRDLVNVWLGNVDLGHAVRSKAIRLEGTRAMVHGFKSWFGLSMFARLAQSVEATAVAES
jgi:DNA-binding HxlR family transcriptional regulator